MGTNLQEILIAWRPEYIFEFEWQDSPNWAPNKWTPYPTKKVQGGWVGWKVYICHSNQWMV